MKTRSLLTLFEEKQGVTAIEYAVIAAAIAVAIASFVEITGVRLQCVFYRTASEIGVSMGGTGAISGAPASCLVSSGSESGSSGSSQPSPYPPGTFGYDYYDLTNGTDISNHGATACTPPTTTSEPEVATNIFTGAVTPYTVTLTNSGCGMNSGTTTLNGQVINSQGYLKPPFSMGNFAQNTVGWIFEVGGGEMIGGGESPQPSTLSQMTAACSSGQGVSTDTFDTSAPPPGVVGTATVVDPSNLTSAEISDLGIPSGTTFPSGSQFVVCKQ